LTSAAKLLATAILLAVSTLMAAAPAMADARSGAGAFIAKLDPVKRRQFEAWLTARTLHEFRLDKFWREVSDKRAERRRKRKNGEPLGAGDYVMAFPPQYAGPSLSAPLAKAWAEYQDEGKGPRPPRQVPTVAHFLDSARDVYGFSPERIAEREFKRRYAREALALGMSKEQVVRIYALETGGQGTADMQSGINPITKQGRAISTALGYAQLLHANSVDELARHGAKFSERLRQLARSTAAHDPQRASGLQAKLKVLDRMIANARSVGGSWDAHVAYAATPPGLGIHALNMDGDIGPWLQAIKLKGLLEDALKAGRTRLAPNEMELMNLAGPGTGLEMMLPAGLNAPTVNFFARGGYERNPIVHGKTSAELLAALDKRMDENSLKPGAVEFAQVFDEIAKEVAYSR
jgi:hypothetical protein